MRNAFKEWALVCEALGRGEQSIIVRKGGIAEGRAGFSFAHDDFLLFPTLFHEQVESLRLPADAPLPQRDDESIVEIRYRVRVEWTQEVNDLEMVRRLAPFHIWRESVIEERFRYKNEGGIHLACVRVAALEPPHIVFRMLRSMEDAARGCRCQICRTARRKNGCWTMRPIRNASRRFGLFCESRANHRHSRFIK